MPIINLDDFTTMFYWSFNWYCPCKDQICRYCIFDKKFKMFYTDILKSEKTNSRKH